MLKTANNGAQTVTVETTNTKFPVRKVLGRIAMTTALTAVALASTPQQSFANDGAWTQWNTQNNFNVSSDGTTTNIDASGNIAGGTSSNLDILGHQTVNVNQSSSDSLFYARAEGNQDPTRILGNLNSNGRLLVIDRNGVFFGPGSSVDVAGIVATTGDVSDEQIHNNEFGNYTFENVTGGQIDLQGQISVGDAGLAAFVAPTVTNSGVINAKVGKVVFASGEKVTLDLYGDNLVEIEVAGKNADALLENTGTINAQGGQVHMTAAAAKNAVDNIINVEGVVTVASATKVGGKIVLSGGNAGVVKVAANLEASGKNGGGKIDVKGQDVQVAENAVLDASATENGDGGRVDVIAENHLDFRGLLLSRGGREGGNGGNAEVSGYGILGYTGRADLSAKNGKMGTLLLDPEFAVIHSGSLHQPLGLGYVLSAQALANTMQTASIIVQANDFIDVGTRTGGYNTGNIIVDAFLNSLADDNIDLSTYDYDRFERTGTGYFWGIPYAIYGWVNYNGTTAGNISFDTATLNINKDLKLGTGNLDINAATVNLNGTLSDVNGLLNQGDITTVASTVNVLSNNALIQQGIYAAAAGGAVNIEAGTFNEGNININKNLLISGAGKNQTIVDASGFTNGFMINSDLGNTNTTLRRMTVQNASQAGVRVSDTANLKVLTLNQMALNNNGHNGVAVYGNSMDDLRILNSDFLNNGGANGSSGDGDILAYLYNGDVTLNNVSVEGNTAANTADYGIQIRGSDTPAASGTITMNNVKIAGDYRAALVGIQRYSSLDLSMTDVVLGGSTTAGTQSKGWGSLYLSELGTGHIDLGNTTFNAVNGQYITLGFGAAYNTTNAIDARDATFEGVTGVTATLAQNFAIEDKIFHKLDNAGQGLVTWHDGNVYVTQLSGSIQRGVDASSVGGTVNVDDGNFVENVNVNKVVKLLSHNGRDTTTVTGISGVGALGTIVVTNNVNGAQIGDEGRGFTIVGFDNGNPGIENAALYYQGAHDGAIVKGNRITAVGDEAMLTEYGQTNSNFVIDGNIFDGQTFTGVDGAWGVGSQFTVPNVPRQLVALNLGHSDITFTNNEVTGNAGSNQLVSIQSNGATVTGNTFDGFTNSAALRVRGSNVDVKNNSIDGNGRGVGILAENVVGLTIGGTLATDGNEINNTGSSAIVVTTGSNAIVQNNLIGTTGGANNIKGDGIYANGSNSIQILNNQIANTQSPANDYGSGIQVINTNLATIKGNTITNSGWDGLRLQNNSNITVDSNTLTNIARVGIWGGNIATATIKGNTVTNDGLGGYGSIHADGGSNWTVSGNDIDGGDYGIRLNGTSGKNIIKSNKIDNVTVDGVYVENITGTSNHTSGVDIESNQIGQNGGNVAGNGVTVVNSPNARAFKNTITAAQKGIFANNVTNMHLYENTISGASVAGLHITNSPGSSYPGNDVDIWRNTITNGAGATGILIENSAYATVGYHSTNPFVTTANGGNTITGGANGIVVRGSNNAYLSHNTISGQVGSDGAASGDGIYVADSNAVQVLSNKINSVGDDGIEVTNSIGTNVALNTIDGTSIGYRHDGIAVTGSTNTLISKNNVLNSGWDGIYVENSVGTDILDNTVTGADQVNIALLGGNTDTLVQDNILSAAQRGILIRGNNDTTVQGNIIFNQTLDGIRAENAGSLVVNANYVGYTDAGVTVGNTDNIATDGIFILNSDGAQVTGNKIAEVGQNGIIVGGTAGYYSNEGATITGNDIRNAGYDGIHVHYANGNVVISENTIDHSGDDGIEAHHINGSLSINNNIITQSGYGISNGGEGSEYGGFDEFGNGHDGIQVSNVTSTGSYNDGVVSARVASVYSPYAVTISGNTIDISGDDGVEVSDVSGRVLISENEITNSGYGNNSSYGDQSIHGSDAIHVRNVFAQNNTPILYTAGSTSTGYYGYDVDVIGNTIDTAADDGIEIVYVGSVLIDSNIITNVGFNPDYSGYEYYSSNYGYGSSYSNGGDGIHVRDVYGNSNISAGFIEGEEIGHVDPYAVVIVNNTIGNTTEEPVFNDDEVQYFKVSEIANSFIGDDGIEVANAGRVLIKDNEITNVGNSADYSNYFNYSYDEGYEYSYNNNETNGGDGIHVRNAGNTGFIGVPSFALLEVGSVSEVSSNGYGVQIIGNTVSMTGDDGIEVANAGRTLIDGNTINNAGHSNGPVYSISEISYGSGDSWGADGIHVRNVGGNYNNDKRFISEEVYFVSDEDMVTITNNSVDVTADDGIQVLYSGNTLIDGNTVTNAGYGRGYDYEGEGSRDGNGADGIHVNTGFEIREVYPGDDLVSARVLDFPGFMNETRVQISNNNVDTTGNDGIETNNVTNLIITDNDVSNAQAHGVLVGGEQNGSVLFSGNTLTNNPVGARFESGLVDISNLENPNRIVNTNISALPIGLQFDGSPESLTIAGQTIGATQFEGFQNAGSYYVRFENGSIMDTVTGLPLLVNGLNASYDGFTPPVSGVLTQAQYDYIEARLFDADDVLVNGRGQIFAGFVPEQLGLSLDNIEDFFNQFGLNGGGANSVQLLITGLPSIGQFNNPAPAAVGNVQPTGNPFDPNFLANLEPAAGGDDTGTEQSSQDLNNIETESGGEEEVSCWGDALNSASNGTTASYSFGGSFEDSMAQQANCASGSVL